MKQRRFFDPGRPRPAAGTGARYSRFVGWMKFVLPLSAAALVLLVVVWPYFAGREAGFPLSFTTAGVGPSDAVYMTRARYLGSDDKDQPYTVTADLVTQATDDPDIIRLSQPKADIQLREGIWLALTADSGVLDRGAETLSLAGAVSLYSDEGYEFRTERAEIDLRGARASGDAPVEAQGPFGTLVADGFRLDNQDRTLRFEGRVRLLLYPKAGA